MTDKENILLENFFKEAAQQQIEDNGFTDRVMESLPDNPVNVVRKWSRLWTLFCVVVALGLFLVFDGWESLKASLSIIFSTVLTSVEVFFTTAPTTEVPLNPVVLLLLVAFVLVFLPYQTYRKLSATL